MNNRTKILTKLALAQMKTAAKTMNKLGLPLKVGSPECSDMLVYGGFYLRQAIAYLEEVLAKDEKDNEG